jgi:hypothetical protein
MSHRIADASAKVARAFYPLPRMTDSVLSASLRQLTGLSGGSADQPLPDPDRFQSDHPCRWDRRLALTGVSPSHATATPRILSTSQGLQMTQMR